MTSPRLLGIDQGTTGTRAVVVDPDGTIVGTGYRAHAQHHPRPGWVEHDAEEIWSAVIAAVDEALESADDCRIAAVGVANQGETVVPWDRTTLAPTGRAIVWQDGRTAERIASLAGDKELAEHVTSVTGLVLDSYFSASKLEWLLAAEPQWRDCVMRSSLAVTTLDSFLIARATDGATFATDVSTAARTLLFDIRSLGYDPRLVATFGIPVETLPAARASDAYFGDCGGLPGRARGAPLHAAIVDQPAALFGQGCLRPGTTKATYGTGCFLYANLGDAPRRSRNGLLTTIAWRRGDQTTYALDGGVFAAGSVVTWMRDNLRLGATAEAIDRLAASVRTSDGVVCVPAFAGLAAPHWDRAARGAVLGLTLSSTSAHVARAALEGVAHRVAEVVTAIEADAGLRIESLRVDGGLTQSAVLMQAQADLLGIPIEVSAEREATAVGAALLAGRAVGVVADDEAVVRRVAIERTYEPSISADERSERRARFARAVDHIRRASAELR